MIHDRAPMQPATPPPLFLLSFRQRDELAGAVAGDAWTVVAARRGEGVVPRFVASGATVAVVDARGALNEGLDAARMLGPVVEARGAAMLVLVSRGDAERLDDFYRAGATHFLASPMRRTELLQALHYAGRYVERMGGWEPGGPAQMEPLGWRWDPQMRLLQVTPALAEILDLPESTTPRAFLSRLDPADRRVARAALRRLGKDRRTTAFAHDLPHGIRLVQHLQYDARPGQLYALVEALGQAPDAGTALRDALGGLRDAAGAQRWITRRLELGQPVIARRFALEQFDLVNREHGRAFGDAMLRMAARRVLMRVAHGNLRRGVLIARLDGPEFLIAAVGEQEREAMEQLASAILESLSRPFVVGTDMLSLDVRESGTESREGDSADLLLRRLRELADQSPGGQAGAPLDRLAAGVRRAVEQGELNVVFQPQVAISSGAIVGVEALARWRHPELGAVGPEELFAAAERADMTRIVSEHIQRRALEEAVRWPRELSGLRLSINVTAGEFAYPDFADRLLDRIDATGFSRARLTVEVTESGVMEDLAEGARLLAELRTAGCRVAIDDFGTGYSSLAYLKALPLDYLKIDKRLSQDITGTARDRVVVRGVIDMARSLGLTVIAEGVETEDQLGLLAKEGCQLYQGFLCAEPLDSATLATRVVPR